MNIRLIKRKHVSARGLVAVGLCAAAVIGCGRSEQVQVTRPPAATAAVTGAVEQAGEQAVALAPTPPAATPAVTESSMVELRRQLYAFEQRFRAEDEVCAALTLESVALNESIISNETVIVSRLQADAEWNRIRNELAEAQRAGDRVRGQISSQRRDEALTNAHLRNVMMMRTDRAGTNWVAPPRKVMP